MLQSLRGGAPSQRKAPVEDLLKGLVQQRTVGGLLKQLRQLAAEEGQLCESVLGALLATQPSLATLELQNDALRGIDNAVKDHRRAKKQRPPPERLRQAAGGLERQERQERQEPTSPTSPPPPKPSPRRLPSGRFADLPNTVEACLAATGEDELRQTQELRRTLTRGKTYMAGSAFGGSSRSKSRLPVFPAAGMNSSVWQRLFLVFQDPDSCIVAKVVEAVVVTTIVVSTLSFVLETLPEFRRRPAECAARLALGLPPTVSACEPKPLGVFYAIEAVCIVVFTVDYFLRLLLAHTVRHPNVGKLWSTLVYAAQPLIIVDFLAILPFYISLALEGQVGFAKVLRLARILRLFKLAKRIPMVSMYAEVLQMSGQPLAILMFFNVIIVTVFGALIYYAEGQHFSVDQKFVTDPRFPTGVYARRAANGRELVVTPFHSIPYSLWWVCVTVTTVGYGDYAPTTGMGRCIGVATFYCGIIFLALPISILGQNFAIVYERFLVMNNNRFPTIHRSSSCMRLPRSMTMKELPWLPPGGLRRRLFRLLEDPSSSKGSRLLSILMMLAILASTASFVCESMPLFKDTPEECLAAAPTVAACEPRPWPVFGQMEEVCIVIFTVDYLLRILLVHAAEPAECGLDAERKYTRLSKTFCYFRQVLNLIDVFAILPFYVELAGGGGGGASVLRILRLVRVFRVLRVPKLKSCAEMFMDVGADALPALCILFCMSMLTCIFFSSCMYFAESGTYSVDPRFLEAYPYGVYTRPTFDGYDVQPSPFSSIPYIFWWFFTTATTVGYGDDFPTTTAGRTVAIFVFMAGVVLLAMPITIVGGSFGKYYEDWVRSFQEPDDEDDDIFGFDGHSPRVSPRASTVRVEMEDLAEVPVPRLHVPHVSRLTLQLELPAKPELELECCGGGGVSEPGSGELPMNAWT